MNLSFKDIQFIIEAIDNLIETYHAFNYFLPLVLIHRCLRLLINYFLKLNHIFARIGVADFH